MNDTRNITSVYKETPTLSLAPGQSEFMNGRSTGL